MWAALLAMLEAALGVGGEAATAVAPVVAGAGEAAAPLATGTAEAVGGTALKAASPLLSTIGQAALGGGASGGGSTVGPAATRIAPAGGSPQMVGNAPRVYSSNAAPMMNDMPLAEHEYSGWDKFTQGVTGAWHGYQDMTIGPGAEELSPEQRSKAFWGAKLAGAASAFGGGDAGAARTRYAQSYVGNERFKGFINEATASARTPEEMERVRAMKAFRQYIKPIGPQKLASRRIGGDKAGSRIDEIWNPYTGETVRQGEQYDLRAPSTSSKAPPLPMDVRLANALHINMSELTDESAAKVRTALRMGDQEGAIAAVEYKENRGRPYTKGQEDENYLRGQKREIVEKMRKEGKTDAQIAALLFGGDLFKMNKVLRQLDGGGERLPSLTGP